MEIRKESFFLFLGMVIALLERLQEPMFRKIICSYNFQCSSEKLKEKGVVSIFFQHLRKWGFPRITGSVSTI